MNKFVFVGIGFTMSVAENLILYPLDTLKTNLQAEGGLAKTSPVRAVRAMIASGGGVKSLYRGFWVSTLGSAPGTIAYLTVYNELRSLGNSFCHRNNVNPFAASLVVPFLSGAMADLASLTLYTPFDVVTTHMQRGREKATYGGRVRDVVGKMYLVEGPRGFFRGFSAAALTYTPTSALWWPSYEILKRTLSPLFLSKEELHDLDQSLAKSAESVTADTLNTSASRRMGIVVAMSGVLAGAIAYALTNPMDLVRTRMILQQETYGETRVLGVLRAVARREGFAALFKGVVPRVMSAAPASALGSFTYELALRVSLKKEGKT